METVNRNLTNLLRCLVMDYTTTWDLLLSHAEFAHNNSNDRSKGCSLFEIVTGMKSCRLVDLVPLQTSV